MKTVIEMAREVADQCSRCTPPTWTHEFALAQIMYMIESARADEREACAMVCMIEIGGMGDGYDCAAAIRARSNT